VNDQFYLDLAGQALRLPAKNAEKPSKALLAEHRATLRS
jgi:hypothetical protein